MLLQDKVVIVSGIGPGLGQELAVLAAREGAEAVVLAARTARKLDSVEGDIAALGLGTKALTKACIPAMIAAGGGAIVMIATMVEHKPLATQAGYGSSKSALRSATKHLALELGQHGIRVNSCHMGWMWGPSVEGYFTWQASETGKSQEELIAEVTRNIPLGVIPDDGECAKAAVFLASDYASVITGAALDVNGGEYMPV